MNVEPLLAHLRAERDRAEDEMDRVDWHRGRVAAFDQAIISIGRWSRGENPDPSVPYEPCPHCSGAGAVRMPGQEFATPCARCRGTGRAPQRKLAKDLGVTVRWLRRQWRRAWWNRHYTIGIDPGVSP